MTWIPCLLLALFLFGSPHVAMAETFVVNTTSDSRDDFPGDGACHDGSDTPTDNCSLRAAIQESNALTGADEIVLPAGTYTLTIPEAGENGSSAGDLDIVASDPLTITGAGQSLTIIDANNIDRVMDVKPGAGPVYLSDLTLQNGGAPLVDADGGGLRIGEYCSDCGAPALTAVTAVRTTVTHNTATGYGQGGGIAVNNGAYLELIESNVLTNTAEGGEYGGISNDGTVEIIDSTLAWNENGVYEGSVGNYGTMTFERSTYAYNAGGITTSGSLIIQNSTFDSNNDPVTPRGPVVDVRNGSLLTIDASTFSYNNGTSVNVGTGSSSTIDASTFSYNNDTSVNVIDDFSSLAVENSTFSSNGGVAISIGMTTVVTMSHTTIAFNSGPGIEYDGGATTALDQVLLSANNPNCSNPAEALFPGPGQFNMSDDDSCLILGTNYHGTIWNAGLEPLQDNGGETETHALGNNSDAIDRGPTSFVGPPFTDQRGDGYPRVVNGRVDRPFVIDIGAFESALVQLVQTGPTYTVNDAGDEDGPCLIDQCTLRQAINAANATPNGAAADTIELPLSVQPVSPLPAISESVLLTGSAASGVVVVLDGSFAGAGASGITIDSGGSTIANLEIRNFNGPGIAVLGGQGNSFNGNRVHNNGGLGIDLGNDGVTINDFGDPDTGPNGLQNAPVLQGATTVGTITRVRGSLSSTPERPYALQFYANDSCDSSTYGEGEIPVGGSYVVNTDAKGYVSFDIDLGSLGISDGSAFTGLATDQVTGDTSEFSRCVILGPNNDSWPRALSLDPLTGDPSTPSATIAQHIDQPGQSRWYKFSVQPGSAVQLKLSDLPANYDLTIYKDIQAIHNELSAPSTTEQLVKLTAEFAPDAFAPDAFAPDAFAPDAFAPDAFAPDAFAPDAFAPDAFAPDAFAPDAFAPDAFAPDAFAPDAFAPDAFAPDAFAPDAFAPDAFAPDVAYSSAQLRAFVAVSAFDGLADETIAVDTWDNSGDYYIRVRGRNGAFNPTATYNLEVQQTAGVCESLVSTLADSTLTPVTGNYRTLILTDLARMDSADPLIPTVQAQLAALAARSEIAGVVVDVGADAAVAAANLQADGAKACPPAKNLVANAVKKIVDAYWELNPGLEYIVVVGNDDVIPFFRYPDRALLANEKNFQPPVDQQTTSFASLILGYVLGQDAYGAATTLSLSNTELPIANLAVGRLVETPSDILMMLAAYDATVTAGTPGVVPDPTSALVTGYDFMEDAALAVQAELAAGIGAPVDSLIAPRDFSPLSTDPRVWTADELRSELSGRRYDVVFLAGHFSANSALAADYSTRLLASEVADASVDLQNVLVFSNGCHSGYNTVNEHGIAGLTAQPDWPQAFASKGAMLIAGTGYQYGDTDFLKYNERIYLNFSQELRVGAEPVPVGKALVAAKQRFLSETTEIRGIHEKAYHVTTLFGLPMMRINLPAGRTTPVGLSATVNNVTDSTRNPGLTLGLQSSDITVTFGLTENTVLLSSVSDDSTVVATYLSGTDGVISNPVEPVLPLDLRDVGVVDTVLRGVGFRGGAYTDLTDILPLTGAAATEIRGVHAPFLSQVFFPIVPWRINYFDLLANPTNGLTRLALVPGQYRSDDPTSLTGILRKWSNMQFRLFYSNNITTYAAGSTPASAAPPNIANISSTVDTGKVIFEITVVGDPAAGVQEVWVTYTSCEGAVCNGLWKALDLEQDTVDSKLWNGLLSLDGTPAENIRFMVHAANGVGLVSMATNLGEYYSPGVDPGDLTGGNGETGQAATTGLTLEAAPTSAVYGTQVTFSARLTDTIGRPLAGQPIRFAIGSQQRNATTDGNGLASVTMPILSRPGETDVRAGFAGTLDYQPSEATSSLTVQKQNTNLVFSPNTTAVQAGATSTMTATLTSADGSRLNAKSVYLVVSGGGSTYVESGITNFVGEVRFGPILLPKGDYTVNVYFSGAIPLPSGTQILTDSNYLPSTVGGTLRIENDPPVVSCPDAPLSVPLPAGVTLSCSVSDDGAPIDPGVTTRLWSQLDGPGSATFDAETSEVTGVSFSAAGLYRLRLIANDGGLSASDEITVTAFTVAELSHTAKDPGVSWGGSTLLTARVLPAAAGATVNFAIESGGGSLDTLAAVTDGDGNAAVTYTAPMTDVVAGIYAILPGTTISDSAKVFVSEFGTTVSSVQQRSTPNEFSLQTPEQPPALVVTKSGPGIPWMGVASFAGNPCPTGPTIIPLGSFVDVLLENPTGVDSLDLVVDYSSSEGVPMLAWCRADGQWQPIEGAMVDTGNMTVSFSVTGDSVPNLSQLEGTPFVVLDSTRASLTVVKQALGGDGTFSFTSSSLSPDDFRPDHIRRRGPTGLQRPANRQLRPGRDRTRGMDPDQRHLQQRRQARQHRPVGWR